MQVISTSTLPETGTSHSDSKVRKKTIIDSGVVPHMTKYSMATFQPGDTVDEHAHDTMYEIYYVQSGEIIFVVDGKEVTLKQDDVIMIAPKEVHAARNEGSEPVALLYFGIATD